MKRPLLILSTVTAVISILVLGGCRDKSKIESRKDYPAATEQTDKKVEETVPAMEHPDSSKPKDHPAH